MLQLAFLLLATPSKVQELIYSQVAGQGKEKEENMWLSRGLYPEPGLLGTDFWRPKQCVWMGGVFVLKFAGSPFQAPCITWGYS